MSVLLGAPPGAAQNAITTRELAAYRLAGPAFRQFEQASQTIGAVTAGDSKFRFAPLFTREVAVSGDAPVVAAELIARLENNPPLTDALRAANLTAREYALFALALLGARMAHGFVEAGVLRRVPPGVAADNVAFVAEHEAEITAVLRALGIKG